jgi:hypothetical protein
MGLGKVVLRLVVRLVVVRLGGVIIVRSGCKVI